ncbi:hypothetical protein D3C85_1183560 [compost metagenome]
MHHAAVNPHATVLGEHVIDRGFHHVFADPLRIVRAGGFDGLQVLIGAGVHAGLNHGRHALGAFEVALGPGAGLIIHVPVPAGDELGTLGGWQADGFDVSDEHHEAGQSLAGFYQAELIGGGYGIDQIRAGAG